MEKHFRTMSIVGVIVIVVSIFIPTFEVSGVGMLNIVRFALTGIFALLVLCAKVLYCTIRRKRGSLIYSRLSIAILSITILVDYFRFISKVQSAGLIISEVNYFGWIFFVIGVILIYLPVGISKVIFVNETDSGTNTKEFMKKSSFKFAGSFVFPFAVYKIGGVFLGSVQMIQLEHLLK